MTLQPARLMMILLAVAAFPALALDKPLVVVNGKTVPTSALESMVKMQASRGQADTPELRAQLKKQLINIELLAQEGSKLGLDKSPEVKNDLELARKEIMSHAMVTDFVKKNPIKDADIKAEYEKYKAQQTGMKEYRIHQTLFEKEDEAKDAIVKLKSGTKFEDIAKQSKDSVSATNGGELDWAPAIKYPKPFGDALTALQKGQLTESPVKTQFGYHVIRLDDIREAKIPTLEEAKPQLSNILMQQKVMAFQKELESKAKIQ